MSTVANPRPSSPGSLTDLIERGRASQWGTTRRRAEELTAAVKALRSALDAENKVPEVRHLPNRCGASTDRDACRTPVYAAGVRCWRHS